MPKLDFDEQYWELREYKDMLHHTMLLYVMTEIGKTGMQTKELNNKNRKSWMNALCIKGIDDGKSCTDSS